MRPLVAALPLAALAACAQAALPPPAAAPVAEGEQAEGRALVLLDADAGRYLAAGYPGGLPPRDRLVALAVGAEARSQALAAFGARFRGGAALQGSGPPAPGAWRVLVEPLARSEVPAFTETRDQGFGRPLAASLELRVTLQDAAGHPVWERSYRSGTLDGPVAFSRGPTGDRLTPAAHRAIAALVERAATEAAARARQG